MERSPGGFCLLEDKQPGCQAQAAPCQTAPQPLSRSRQPAGGCATWATNLDGRFVHRLPFEVTQDDQGSQTLGQAVDFMVKDLLQFFLFRSGGGLGRRGNFCRGGQAPFPGCLPGALAAKGQGCAVSHFVEPTGDGIALLDAAGPAREDQNGGLESVLGIVRVTEDALANAEYQTCMPPEEQLESGLVPTGNETLEELAIADAAYFRRRMPDTVQNQS